MEKILILEPDEVSWTAYKTLRLQALQHEPQAFGSSYTTEIKTSDEEWQRRLDNYIKGEHDWMFFARVDNKLVGMLGAFQTEEDEKEHAATIIGMFVTREYRGKGIATMLMKRILDELKAKHMLYVKINVNVDRVIALQMYQKFGFVIKKKLNFMMGDGKYHDEYAMQMKLV